MTKLPLPHTCSHEAYVPGAEDDWGNAEPGWAAPVATPCFWWPGGSTEPTQSEQAAIDLTLVVDVAVTVDQRDVFVVDGKRCEVVGLPQVFDNGPFNFAPGRQVVSLHWVG